MKKILAATLAVLMLLPMLASIALADIQIPEGVESKNVASEATVEVVDTNNMNISVGDNVDTSAIVDGDKTTGTNSPQGRYYSYVLNYDNVHYFTDIVIACNGSGTLATGEEVKSDTYNIKKIIVKIYYGSEVTYQSEALDVSKLKEVSVQPNAKGDKVEIYKVSGSGSRTEYMWEVETYAPDMALCNAQVENVATEAVFSATGGNANFWWAMDYKRWVDGDPLTGSHSPKGRNYSVWMHYPKEYLFSEINLVCNTEGGATLAHGTVDERYFGNSIMQVVLYNYNEDLVWDSGMVDTSTVTEFSVAPYVEAAIIEIKFFNGNFGGGEYMYEVSTYAQSGDHVFVKTAEENPTCLVAGVQEYTCHCGKVIKKSVPATGFHKWSDVGEISKGASATENGVMAYPCLGCDLYKLRDIPSTGHNWDSGTKVAPSCESEGYTLYKCTDSGCSLEYKADYVDGYVHQWDEGVLTKKPSVTEEGVITYTCSVCKGHKYGRIRKHKYTDNVTDFTSASIKKTDVVINKENELYSESYTGGNPGAVFDGEMLTSWYGPGGTYVVYTLDKDYIFTSGFFYMSSNYSSATIEFLDADDNVVVKYETGAVDHYKPDSPKELDMLDKLSAGVRACKIKLTTVGAKWANGSAATMHELKLKVHACDVGEEDYILSGSEYVAPKCGKDGKCIAYCQVCGVKNDVVLEAGPDAGHNYSSVSEVIAPTCQLNGVGIGRCVDCGQEVENVTIPATGKHNYTVETEVVSPKCGFAGVGHMVCETCDKVGSIYEIDPTGVHEREWSLQSLASYTAVGKTVYACKFCGDNSENDAEKGTNVEIAEKHPIPEDILTFVGVSKTSDNNANTLSITFKINLEYFAEIQETCDIRIITAIKDANGREAVIESYGKYATNSYNEETGEFTVTIYPKNGSDTFEATTAIRLMNFRGVVYKYFAMGTYGTTISMDSIK